MKTEANISTFKGYYFLSRCLSLCVFFRITLIFWHLTLRFLPQKAWILFFYQIVALHGKRKGSLKHMYKNIYGKQKSLPFDLYFFYKKWSKILQIFSYFVYLIPTKLSFNYFVFVFLFGIFTRFRFVYWQYNFAINHHHGVNFVSEVYQRKPRIVTTLQLILFFFQKITYFFVEWWVWNMFPNLYQLNDDFQ